MTVWSRPCRTRAPDFGGPPVAPFRYSADSHLGISGMRIVEIQGDKTKDLTPVLVTDIGDAEITEDTSGSGDDGPPEGWDPARAGLSPPTPRPGAGHPPGHRPCSSPAPAGVDAEPPTRWSSPMLRKIAGPASRVVERWLPGAFVFAVALTVVVAALSLLLTDTGPKELTLAWGTGLTDLLSFMTQVALVLLLGYTLANLPPVRRLLAVVARAPRGPRSAYAFVAVVAGLASLLSFGLGLIVGGVVAVEVARRFRDRGTPLHYPLLVASAYAGFVVWHMGYSGSGPLNAATESGGLRHHPRHGRGAGLRDDLRLVEHRRDRGHPRGAGRRDAPDGTRSGRGRA